MITLAIKPILYYNILTIKYITYLKEENDTYTE